SPPKRGRGVGGEGEAITLRAIIPEPGLWSPQVPHLYAGPVELWQDGVRCDVLNVRHGLRHVVLGARGLRWNGELLSLKGREADDANEEQMLAWRAAGVNLLVIPVRPETRGVWERADRIGHLILGRPGAETPPGLVEELADHPCSLGWLVRGEAPELPGLVLDEESTDGSALPGALTPQ